MKHVRTLTKGPEPAQDIPVSVVIALIQDILSAFLTFFQAKEDAQNPN